MTKDLKLFFDNFDILAESPSGVQKLRELILQLAVQGKLVPQNPNDEPASELLEKIKTEKEKLVKEGKIKKQKPLPPIEPEEIPYKLPKGWEWAKLDEVANKITDGEHLSPKKTTSGVFLLTAKHVTEKGVSINEPQFISKEDAIKSRERCDPERGDILICSRGTIGRCTVVNIDEYFCLMGSVILVKPNHCVAPDYITYFLKTKQAQQWMLGSSGATAVKALYLKDIRNCPLAVPPLAEQKRIVAKVDELMALCDELEEKQQKTAHSRVALNDSAIDHLLNAETAKEFDKFWQLICNNFGLLYNDFENVNKLRQAILQLAVQGKLVPQDPNDELASELLKKIKAEKEQLIKDGKIKKQKLLPPIEPDEVPCKLPKGWEWARIDDVKVEASTGLDRPRSLQSPDYEHAYFKMNNISPCGNCDFFEITRINASEEEVAKYRLFDGDFLFNTRNSYELVGKTCVFVNELDGTFLYNNNILRISFFSGINPWFINLWFISPTGKALLNALKSSTTNVAAIYQGKLMGFLLPIPTPSEQKRIVKKVDELMALCGQMEEKIKQSQDKSEKLMAATVHHLLVA